MKPSSYELASCWTPKCKSLVFNRQITAMLTSRTPCTKRNSLIDYVRPGTNTKSSQSPEGEPSSTIHSMLYIQKSPKHSFNKHARDEKKCAFAQYTFSIQRAGSPEIQIVCLIRKSKQVRHLSTHGFTLRGSDFLGSGGWYHSITPDGLCGCWVMGVLFWHMGVVSLGRCWTGSKGAALAYLLAEEGT